MKTSRVTTLTLKDFLFAKKLLPQIQQNGRCDFTVRVISNHSVQTFALSGKLKPQKRKNHIFTKPLILTEAAFTKWKVNAAIHVLVLTSSSDDTIKTISLRMSSGRQISIKFTLL